MTVKRRKEKYKPGWLRLRMVYKRSVNMKAMLLADVHTKVMHGIFDAMTALKDCKCRDNRKVNGTCVCLLVTVKQAT